MYGTNQEVGMLLGWSSVLALLLSCQQGTAPDTGQPQDIEAAPADVDGDGRADAVVFDPESGNWSVSP